MALQGRCELREIGVPPGVTELRGVAPSQCLQVRLLIPEQVAHLFRNDVARPFQDDRAQRSDLIPPAIPG
jgi:hypothetical protein